jgi:hypothetical protein
MLFHFFSETTVEMVIFKILNALIFWQSTPGVIRYSRDQLLQLEREVRPDIPTAMTQNEDLFCNIKIPIP